MLLVPCWASWGTADGLWFTSHWELLLFWLAWHPVEEFVGWGLLGLAVGFGADVMSPVVCAAVSLQDDCCRSWEGCAVLGRKRLLIGRSAH